MRNSLNGIFFKKFVSEKERKQNEKKREDARPTNEGKPYRGSDGYWRVWINDGRGGYDQILPRGEQDWLDWDGGR